MGVNKRKQAENAGFNTVEFYFHGATVTRIRCSHPLCVWECWAFTPEEVEKAQSEHRLEFHSDNVGKQGKIRA